MTFSDKNKNKNTNNSFNQEINSSLKLFIQENFSKEQVAIYPLAGDASLRKYYRMIMGPTSWIIMQVEAFEKEFKEQKYPFLSVQKHFLQNSIFVPGILQIDATKGIILLEDLGDLTLERKFWENQDQSYILPFYFNAIDELIKINFVASKDHSPCTAFQIKFDTKNFLWEMNYTWEHLIEKLNKIEISAKIKKEIQNIFLEICSSLDNQKKCIVHRDYHSRNLMIKLGKIYCIDFQDARMGPAVYDLASLVYDSYVNLNENIINEIIQYYLTESKKHSLKDYGLQDENFDYIFSLQVIQRSFKASGSFASFYNLRQDTRYLKYLPKTLKIVANNLINFPKFKTFLNILQDNGLSEKNYEK